MADPAPRSRWRDLRRIFRWMRIAVLLLVLGLIGGVFYLNRVGLPDFAKRKLLAELRAQGLELQVGRLRLAWSGAVVADHVLLGDPVAGSGPSLYAQTMELRPDYQALRRLKFGPLGGLTVHEGRLHWHLDSPDRLARKFVLDQIQLEMRFLPGEQWHIDRFMALYAGARLRVTGSITNPLAFRQPPPDAPDRGSSESQVAQTLNRLVDSFDQIRFASPPELNLVFGGDAKQIQSFHGVLTVLADRANSPWGSASSVNLTARVRPALDPGQPPFAVLDLEAGSVLTPWASTRNVKLMLHFAALEGMTNAAEARLELTAASATTEWCEAGETRGAFQWTQSLTNPIPLAASGDVFLSRIRTKWGKADGGHLAAQFRPAASQPAQLTEPGASWWQPFAPYRGVCHVALTNVEAQELTAQALVCDAEWQPSELSVTNLAVQLYGGRFEAQLALDLATREARAKIASEFEVMRLAPILPESAVRQLQEITWEKPPKLGLQASAILPAWTNRQPDWQGEVLPTLALAAEVECGPASYRNVQITGVQAAAAYSNSCLTIPKLHLTRPEGQLDLIHFTDERSKERYFDVTSTIDPMAVKPLLGDWATNVFGLIHLEQPPQLSAQLWVAPDAKALRGAAGRIALTNFSFRGESVVSCRAALRFTNNVLEVYQPDLVRTDGVARAGLVRIAFDDDTLFLTNGFSTTDPMVIMRAIGTNTAKAIAPYRFLRPPTAYVSGSAPLHGSEGFDLHVRVEGGPFHWTLFNLPNVSGTVHYVSNTVTIEGVQAEGYSGRIAGNAQVTVTPDEPGDRFRFYLTVTNADLHLLMRDVFSRSNQLEGALSGRMTVTSGNTLDWESWNGYGEVTLRDGLIWELPLFGVFTPILNGIVPGLGQSRFTRGGGLFTITNSVVHSEKLEMNAPLLRMDCRGSVDFHERVNAKIELEPLRNTWGLGPLLRTVLWPVTKALEYKVTGTLGDPNAVPLHAPAKLLLFPLQPFSTLRDIFGSDAPKTNAPPLPPR